MISFMRARYIAKVIQYSNTRQRHTWRCMTSVYCQFVNILYPSLFIPTFMNLFCGIKINFLPPLDMIKNARWECNSAKYWWVELILLSNRVAVCHNLKYMSYCSCKGHLLIFSYYLKFSWLNAQPYWSEKGHKRFTWQMIF